MSTLFRIALNLSVLAFLGITHQGRVSAETWSINFDFGYGDAFSSIGNSPEFSVPEIKFAQARDSELRSTFLLLGNYQVDVRQPHALSGFGWSGIRARPQDESESFAARRGRGGIPRAQIVQSPGTILADEAMSFDPARLNVARLGSTIGRGGAFMGDPGSSGYIAVVATASMTPLPIMIDLYSESLEAYFDDLVITAETILSPDIDRDLYFTCDDYRTIEDAIRNGISPPHLDLSLDGNIDTMDLIAWKEWAGATLPGDANLDGTVDGQDFGIWNANKFRQRSSWCSGDFNADGFVDGSDFGIWNANKFTSADILTVPEPSLFSMLCLLSVAASILHRMQRERYILVDGEIA